MTMTQTVKLLEIKQNTIYRNSKFKIKSGNAIIRSLSRTHIVQNPGEM